MNRAERRRLAKAEQKKATEKVVNVKPSELAQYKNDVMENAVNGYFEVTMVCTAWMLHEEFGFGGKRIMRAMQKVNEIYQKIEQENGYYLDIINYLDEKMDIQIGTEEDFK